ncbi:MAG: succinylglutamate desuccinylase/aspartoacylase family protein [Gemmatimonadota bacterium]|nr:succinylglutamate desuccinylase/aspartoacylase family protein [Gemmatimonadota bacterium]
MSSTDTGVSAPGTSIPERGDRLIGTYRGEEAGPLLLCISSLHGNEPAGVEGLIRVLEGLDRADTPMRGDLVGLRGNLTALERNLRYVDEDLNRVWQRGRVGAILDSLRAEEEGDARREGGDGLPMVGNAELAEQRDLLDLIRRETRRARGPIYVLDLHTTSSESAPFTTLGDTLQNRALAFQLPIPVVLGLEEQIEGPMLQYFDRLGWASIGIEGGAHAAESSIDAHEDSVWVLLVGLGLVAAEAAPDLPARRARLLRMSHGLPAVVDVRYRHGIRPADRFRMKPGFRNFERVRAGQALGSDRQGTVRSPMSGRLFLPLYQAQGDDGFFIVRRVHPAWLVVSRWLRALRADRLSTWIPGVQRHPEREGAVLLSPWARNRFVVDLLHLLGYNARPDANGVMVRRVEDDRAGSELDPRV